ncbi:CLUMA_CG005490, isoform A [Clunio marinus]|uniref:CLUMA_CG005490, isoform A n=1 Tax=Clunio marinus TaxID=568069 RepID=A0A1J1HV27_9DIPT|nr:CLUMA_CG005490, isoform A [Clunio marinus]
MMLGLSLNLAISATVIISCFIFVILSFFKSLRKRFPKTVNCWFCNSNTRVPYNNQNSFTCPSCLQFNGFTDDGDYNREIPEQHYSKLNTSSNFYSQRTEGRRTPFNGLCDPCNRNQEMKIIQLANFKPRFEANYDEEIEEYRQKLEDSYQLCQECNRHLRKTLNRVKTKLIGSKISQLVSKGIKSLNYQTQPGNDRQILSKIKIFTIFILSVVNLVKVAEIDLSFLRSIAHGSFKSFYFHLIALRLTIKDLLMKILNELNLQYPADLSIDYIALTAIILNYSILRNQKQAQNQVIFSMLFWSIKMVVKEFPINSSYILAIDGSIAAALVITSLATIIKSFGSKKSEINQSSSFHKIHADVNEESDVECDTSNSYDFDVRSLRSSIISQPSSRFNGTLRESTLKAPIRTSPLSETIFHNSTFVTQPSTRNKTITNFDTLSNRSFSIRQEVTAAERNQVHKDINRLNISGSLLGSSSTIKDFQSARNLNPFSLENSRCGSPTPTIASVFSGCHRTQVITPPRLETSFMPEAVNTSWVGGGYWSSPQKQYLEVNYFKQQTNPDTSRSSSQSSGVGTIDSEKNSRESSVGKDEISSIFSEPIRKCNLFGKSPDNRSIFGQSFVQAPKVNNFFLNNSNDNNFRKYRNSTFLK